MFHSPKSIAETAPRSHLRKRTRNSLPKTILRVTQTRSRFCPKIPAIFMKTRNFRGEGVGVSAHQYRTYPAQPAAVAIQCQVPCSQWDWLMYQPCTRLS